ncbi:MAG: hypothetical protein V4462_14355 [Pseudomonadota bacterium]
MLRSSFSQTALALTLLTAAGGTLAASATASAPRLDSKHVESKQPPARRPDMVLAQIDAPAARPRQPDDGAPAAPQAKAPAIDSQPSAWLILLLGAMVIVLRWAAQVRSRPFE